MSRTEIKLDSAGIAKLLSSEEIGSFVEGIANECVSTTSGNYEVNSMVSKGRKVTNIKTADRKTYFQNLKNNELIKAVSPNKRR